MFSTLTILLPNGKTGVLAPLYGIIAILLFGEVIGGVKSIIIRELLIGLHHLV